MKVSLFNCRMDIWYVLKKTFNYCNYHLKEIMTDNSRDCRVLKKLTRQTWLYVGITYYISLFGLFCSRKVFISVCRFQISKKSVSAIRKHTKLLCFKSIEGSSNYWENDLIKLNTLNCFIKALPFLVRPTKNKSNRSLFIN